MASRGQEGQQRDHRGGTKDQEEEIKGKEGGRLYNSTEMAGLAAI